MSKNKMFYWVMQVGNLLQDNHKLRYAKLAVERLVVVANVYGLYEAVDYYVAAG